VLENPSWSPNGRSIVFERNDPPAVGVHWDGAMGDVGFIDVRTERTRWIVTDAPSYQPSWSSDGILVSLSPVAVESDSVAGGS
jgi:Tol biopolymer transport system component